MTERHAGERRLTWVAAATLIVLGFGLVLRLLWLDADPYYYDWVGYVTDEGRWVSYARQAALFDSVHRNALFDLHLVLAPLYELLNYATFKLAGGTSLFWARAWTAAFGCALLLLFWRAMRPTVTPEALFVGVTLLAVQVDFISLSRVAVPEMVIVFFQAAIYFSLVKAPGSPKRLFLSGLLLLIAIGMKGTIALSAGIFTLVVLLMPRPQAPSRAAAALRDAAWFCAGFGGPALVAAAIGFVLLPSAASSATVPVGRILGFLRINTPYSIASVPFTASLAPTLDYLLLGLWLSALAWIGSRSGADLDEQHRRHLVASSVWTAFYLVLMVVLEYFPQRYRVHVFLPMTIGITVGLSALQQLEWRHALQLSDRARPTSLFLIGLVALPSAVVLAPVYASVLGLAGVDPEALRMQIACVAISFATMVVVGHLFSRHLSASFLIAFPIVAGGFWLLTSAPGFGHLSFWPSGETIDDLALRLMLVGLSATAAGLWVLRTRGATPPVRSLAMVYVAGFFLTSVVRVAPAYLQPQYTIRDASRDLGTTLANVPSVSSARAEGMFNENTLPYQPLNPLARPIPDAVVTAFEGSRIEEQLLSQYYSLAKTYPIHAAPEYYTTHQGARPPVVRVYRRKQ